MISGGACLGLRLGCARARRRVAGGLFSFTRSCYARAAVGCRARFYEALGSQLLPDKQARH